MAGYKSKSVCVSDNGLFSELARTLSRSFGQVWYTSPWVSAFPLSEHLEVAEGMVEIDRIDDIHEIINDCDLFVFPDIYQAPIQIYLASIGKRVWGAREGDELEIYRKDSRAHCHELGIPLPEYEVIKGMNAVRKYIKNHDGEKLWVKGNKPRGDFETFCVEGYDLGKNQLDDIETRLGPKADQMTYIVEQNLKASIDLAIDTHCIDGQYPDTTVLGTEEKGECYVGEVAPWAAMPNALREIYSKLSRTLKQYEYRNFLSLESRAFAKRIYLGDPCCRAGSPPLELQLNWITNLADILWEGAEGHMVNPVYDGRFGVELIVHSDWANKHPLLVEFPEKYRDKIKFRYNSEFEGNTWIMPQGVGPRIAAIVSHGNSIDACIEECKEISSQLKGTLVESFTRSFPIVMEKIETLKTWGHW
jgi:hypothetical protein